MKEDDEVRGVRNCWVREDLFYKGGVVLAEGVHAVLVGEELEEHLGLLEVRLRVFSIVCVIYKPLRDFGVVIEVLPVDLAKLLQSAQNVAVVEEQVEVVFDAELENQTYLIEELTLYVVDELEGEAFS